MKDQYPCMQLECDHDAIYGVSFQDGSGTMVCETHREIIIDNYGDSAELYKLDEVI